MDLNTQPGADGAAEQTPVDVITLDNNDTYISPSSAGRALANARAAKRTQEQPEVSAPEATPVTESAVEADAAPPQEAPGETQETEPAELPPIEPPRSWTKDEKDRFNSLPRETQEYIASREQERERAVRQSQNEAAEQRKAIEAERVKVDQARQQYESALPILLQNLQSAMAGEFADIQTMADVQRMANEDFPRYVRWDAQQKQLAAVQQEIVGAQQRQAQDRQTKLAEFMRSESEKFVEQVPEFADETQRSKLQNAAVSVLRNLGFKDQELGELWRGEKELSIHDHRVQLLIHDGVKFRESKEKAKAIVAAPKPPVLRPGAAKPKGADAEARIQALTQKLDTTRGINAIRAGAQLIAERRKAAR